MANITLPDETAVRAVDTAAFTWDDLMDGLLTEQQGSVIKLVVEDMDDGTNVNLFEQFSATGKTAKFINDNCSNSANINIVTTDSYMDTFLTTSEYFQNTGNVSNVFKNSTSGQSRITYNDAGQATQIELLDFFGDDANVVLNTIDLTSAPTTLGTNDLTNYENITAPNTHIVDHAGTSLDTSGNFAFDVAVIMPWPVTMQHPLHEAEAFKKNICSIYNKLPIGGAMIIFNFHLPKVNDNVWAALNALTAVGKGWQAEWVLNSETDNSGYWQAGIIKKTDSF